MKGSSLKAFKVEVIAWRANNINLRNNVNVAEVIISVINLKNKDLSSKSDVAKLKYIITEMFL